MVNTYASVLSVQRRGTREEGSIALALLVSIIASGLITVIVATVITGQRSVRFDQDFTRALHVAEHGVEQALFDLNNGLLQPTDLDSNNQASGSSTTEDGLPYEYTVDWDGQRSWTVVSTGGHLDGVQRTIEAVIEDVPRFHLAAFSDRFLEFGGGNTADSYNSETGAWCTNTGRVGSNLDMDFPGGAQKSECHKAVSGDNRTVDGVDLYDWAANPGWPDELANQRCVHNTGSPNNCRTGAGEARFDTHDERRELHTGVDDDSDPKPFSVTHMNELLERCEADGSYRAEFRASAWDGKIAPASSSSDGPELYPGDAESPRYWCFGKAVFDVHTALDGASAGNPVIMVVRHSVAVERDKDAPSGSPPHPHVHCINCQPGPGAGADAPVAAALQIYTPSDSNPSETDGNVVKIRQQSIFAGVVWAPQGACGGLTGSGAGVHIYGSLVCGDIRNVGGWQFHFDEALLSIGINDFAVASWSEQQSG